MLSVEHPSLLSALRQFRYGLMPVFVGPTSTGAIIFKLPKEAILAARLKNEIKVYLLSDGRDPASHLGLVTAFFEDDDEPLVIATMLFSGDDLLTDVVSVLSEPEFNLYFFDEHNREWMGVRAINSDMDRCRRELATSTFTPCSMATYVDLTNRLHQRFAVRDEEDDRAAFTLTFGERLYPDDLVILDVRPEAHQFREAQSHPAIAQLIREMPGPSRERDIAVLLSRVFPAESIHLNPFRADTARELTDVMVVTDREILFVEAKDSPNTAISLSRSLERKRQAVQKHIEKATKQLRGALSYAQHRRGVTIQTTNGPVTVPLDGRQLLGLVVVSEMFDDNQFANSEPLLDLVDNLRLPVMLIDYAGLHTITLNLRTPEGFVDALHNLFDVAIEHRRFPRSIWSAVAGNASLAAGVLAQRSRTAAGGAPCKTPEGPFHERRRGCAARAAAAPRSPCGPRGCA